jgi:mutator protein MutT
MSKIAGPMPVVAGIIENKAGKILIAQRPESSRFGGGLWEFPGGKVDVTESPELALVRELQEELGIDVQIDVLVDVISHVYEEEDSGLHILLMVYKGKWLHGDLQNLEVADSRWVTFEEMKSFEFAVADQKIVSLLSPKN